MELAVASALELAGAALFAPFAKGAGFGCFDLKSCLERRYGQAETGHPFHSLKTRTLQISKSAAPENPTSKGVPPAHPDRSAIGGGIGIGSGS